MSDRQEIHPPPSAFRPPCDYSMPLEIQVPPTHEHQGVYLGHGLGDLPCLHGLLWERPYHMRLHTSTVLHHASLLYCNDLS